MVVNCPHGIGDSATILPKLVSLAEEKSIDCLTYYLTGFYPHLIYRLLINFNFGVPTKYILSPRGGDDFIDGNVIDAHPNTVNRLTHIPDAIITEKYWERFKYLEYRREPRVMAQLETLLQELASKSEYDGMGEEVSRWLEKLQATAPPDVSLSKYIRHRQKGPYPVVFQPFTSLRSPRNFRPERFTELFKAVVAAFEDSQICLVGTYEDYLHIKSIVNAHMSKNIVNMMGLWDVAEVVQAIFDAEVVVGCNSWIPYLAAMVDKRSAMYVLGGLHVEREFQGRIVSKQFYGFDSISLPRNLKVDRMIEFLKG